MSGVLRWLHCPRCLPCRECLDPRLPYQPRPLPNYPLQTPSFKYAHPPHPHQSHILTPPHRNATSRLTILESYDLVTLAADEIVDDGIILETDPVIVASRVSKAPAQDAPNMKNLDLSEQGLLNIWEFAKKKGVEAVRNNL